MGGWGMDIPKAPQYVTDLARRLRLRQTKTEGILWASLRNRKLGEAKFRRQRPLGRYIADFYCYDVRLVIELQGEVHNLAEQQAYDAVRQEIIEQRGIRVLIFKNEEVIHDLERVLAVILNAITPTSPTAQSPLSPRERATPAAGSPAARCFRR